MGIDNPETDDDNQLVPSGKFCSTSGMDQFLSPQDHCNVCSEISITYVQNESSGFVNFNVEVTHTTFFILCQKLYD